MSNFSRDIQVTLLCKLLPVIDEPVTVGIQDKQQNVYGGQQERNGSSAFKCVISFREKGEDKIDFFGSFVHGTPSGRFLYLSWKRNRTAETPWVQRVKIPLSLLTQVDLADANEIVADITGRRPHATEPISWKIIGTGKRRSLP